MKKWDAFLFISVTHHNLINLFLHWKETNRRKEDLTSFHPFEHFFHGQGSIRVKKCSISRRLGELIGKLSRFLPWHTLKVGYFRTKKILDKLTKLSILYWRHISKRLKHIFFEKVHSWHFLTQFLVYIFFFHSGFFFLMINDWFFSTIGQQFFWVAFEIVFP